MNIFATYNDPYKSALVLDDKRVNKMILESAQMLSTSIHIMHNGWRYADSLYKATHKNHPCNIWVRSASSNYDWLFDHYVALIGEYRKRSGGKSHKTDLTMTELLRAFYTGNSQNHDPFPNSSMYKDMQNVHRAYRETMVHKWIHDKRIPTWYGMSRHNYYSIVRRPLETIRSK